ncbi:uncharacterized protein LOC125557616 [Nematostella vectensis]|uniref:uncharacterized protein LOC125557616 n=1 Tax=Nematostella vectensis TaxID=45351 RepID=UPI0020772F2C|nr:uncharacterized protein LOC125557616 [Nematostella vectensis]
MSFPLIYRNVRPLLASLSQPSLFTTSCGEKIEKIHKCLKSFVKSTGCLSEKKAAKMSPTIVRKLIVSNTRDLGSPTKRRIATAMAHKLSTAELYYAILDKQTASAERDEESED